MTKKMLAVALMACSVVVLAGCNKTPTEPEEVLTPEMTGAEEVNTLEVYPAGEEVAVEVMTGTTGAEEVAPVVIEQPVEIVAAE